MTGTKKNNNGIVNKCSLNYSLILNRVKNENAFLVKLIVYFLLILVTYQILLKFDEQFNWKCINKDTNQDYSTPVAP